jgi:hypothetical protein
MDMNSKLGLLSGCLFASVVGCSSGNANIGDGMPTASLGANLSDYKGSWDGYVEAATFVGGSDRLRIEFDENGVGTFRVGDSPEVGPPTDPEAAYPPGADDIEAEPRPEFRYAVNATVNTRRLQFQANTSAPYAAYCAILTPVYDSINLDYACVRQNMAGLPPVGWRGNCRGLCPCTETACTLESLPNDIEFDGALESDGSLSGTIAINQAERYTVRMTR